MLLLLFKIGDGRYAITVDQIVEIAPLVKLKTIPMAPPYVAGLMNYRGLPVPVVDLGELVVREPCEPRFSTRIILVNYKPADGDKKRIIGMIASQVTETIKTKMSSIPSSGVLMDDSLYPDGIEADTEGMVQWFDINRILPDKEMSVLFQV